MEGRHLLLSQALLISVCQSQFLSFLPILGGRSWKEKTPGGPDLGQRQSPDRIQKTQPRDLAKVGFPCVFNVDCGDSDKGLHCHAGKCVCAYGFVQSQVNAALCLRKVNPGEAGCVEKVQCASVWEGARCNLGRCQCPGGGRELAVETRDGVVCVRDEGDSASCPLPVGLEADGETPQGAASLLYTPDGVLASCSPGKSPCSVAGQPGLAELYDCLPMRNPSSPGHCCPSRALACLLPLQEGTGDGSFHRWHYSAAADACQEFIYRGGAKAAANNFGSKEHCESYCKERCAWAAPAYIGGGSGAIRPLRCSASLGCPAQFDCTRTATGSDECCRPAAHVCGPMGGLSFQPLTPSPGFDGAGPGSPALQGLQRWYFDASTKQCRSFDWTRFGGSFNNWASQAHCEEVCARLCELGDPLRTAPEGPPARCPCPGDYACENGVCCPTPRLVCTQPRQPGQPCADSSDRKSLSIGTRYFYNAVTQRCEAFVFGGCGGNRNSFRDEAACMRACAAVAKAPRCPQGRPYALPGARGERVFASCRATAGCPAQHRCVEGACCPTKALTCSLPPDPGAVCGPPSTRHFFDPASGRCASFTYLGCDGNSNSFASEGACEEHCAHSRCPDGGAPTKDSRGQPLACDDAPCPQASHCSGTALGPSPRALCCPSKASLCKRGPQTGSGNCASTPETRYYFDSVSASCRPFTFNGCEEEGSNFLSLSECSNFCGSSACPPGEVVLGGGGSSAATCELGVPGSCPRGYHCHQDQLFNRNVCCGAEDLEEVCGSGERAFIEAGSRRARRCQPGTSLACPRDFLCRRNSKDSSGEQVCCRPTVLCPRGRVAARPTSPDSRGPVRCSASLPACPAAFACQFIVLGAASGFCCSEERLCPSGEELLELGSGRHQACSPADPDACPSGFVCTDGGGAVGSFCCSSKDTAHLCQNSGTVFKDAAGTPLRCEAPGSPCPPGHACSLESRSGRFHCCSERTCPPPTTAQVVNGRALHCNPSSGGGCGLGFECRGEPGSVEGVCCSRSSPTDVCGPAFSAYSPGGDPLTCQPGRNLCGPNRLCKLHPPSQRFYCCEPKVGTNPCSSGSPFLLGDGQPRLCSAGNCPPPFACTFSPLLSTQVCCTAPSQPRPRAVAEDPLPRCPDGRAPDGRSCSPSQPNACGYGATCQPMGARHGRAQHRCCRGGSPGPLSVATLCSNGNLPTSLACEGVSSAHCPPQTSCLALSDGSGQRRCCADLSLNPECPGGGTATSVHCALGSGTCGAGNSCQHILGGRTVCCVGINATGSVKSGGVVSTRRSQGQDQGQLACPGGGALASPHSFCAPSPVDTCQARNARCELVSGKYQCCEVPAVVSKPFTIFPGRRGYVISSEVSCPVQRRYKYPGTMRDLSCVIGGPRCPPAYFCKALPGSFAQEGVCCSFRRGLAHSPLPQHVSAKLPEPASEELGEEKGGDYYYGETEEPEVGGGWELGAEEPETGCWSSEDCSAGRCEGGVCVCAAHELVGPHGGCVAACPAGTANVAGRCQWHFPRRDAPQQELLFPRPREMASDDQETPQDPNAQVPDGED